MKRSKHARAGTSDRAVGRPHPALLVLAVVLIVSAVIFRGLTETARARAVEDAEAILDRATITIHNWFDRYRPLPALYARDPRIRRALESDPEPGDLDGISRELAAWNDIAGTLDTYLLDPGGTAIAASNWQENYSFVGQNYGFRPYYSDAITGRETEFFGLGTMSGLRGYFLSAPVERDGEVLGVMVVKVSVPALEAVLDHGAHHVFVADDAGVAIISGTPALGMTALDTIPPGRRADIERTRRYELDAVGPTPIETTGHWDGTRTVVRAPAPQASDERRAYLQMSRSLPQETWRLNLLYDLRAFRGYLWSLAATIFASAVAVTALVTLVLQRRNRLIERLADRERDKAELARRVARRTAELTRANESLEGEVAERRAAEDSLRRTQNELVQAGKLAALGQMSAALSHEFNQPLTAIRTYTENAAAFYEAGRGAQAGENLSRVLRLTEKVAHLSKHLTRFTRRSDDDTGPVEIDLVISEALELLAARIEKSDTTIRRTGARGAMVVGGATRLQHVLMNLISNAIDAACPDRPVTIEIAVDRYEDRIVVSVTDDGSGIAPETLPKIFDPFFTTKEVGQGLGLGLSICFNIVKDFGGTMQAENRPEGGARFVVTLRDAAMFRVAAE